MSPAALQNLLRAAPVVFAVLWSTGYIGAKLGAPYAEPFTFLTLRFALVFVLLAPVFGALGLRWPRGRALADALLTGVLMHGIYLGGIFWVIDRGLPTGIAALIVSMQPLSTALLAWPLLGERPGRRTWIGLILGLAGTLLVLGPKVSLVAGGSGAGAGIDAMTIGVSLLSLLSITLGTIHQKRQGSGQAGAADPRTSFAVQFIGATAVVGPAALLLETRDVIWSGQFVFALAWLVVVLSLGAFGLLMLMLRHSAVSRVAALFYLIPVITALMAYPLFGETLVPVQIAGMALVVVAVMVAARAPALSE